MSCYMARAIWGRWWMGPLRPGQHRVRPASRKLPDGAETAIIQATAETTLDGDQPGICARETTGGRTGVKRDGSVADVLLTTVNTRVSSTAIFAGTRKHDVINRRSKSVSGPMHFSKNLEEAYAPIDNHGLSFNPALARPSPLDVLGQAQIRGLSRRSSFPTLAAVVGVSSRQVQYASQSGRCETTAQEFLKTNRMAG